jgi:glycosyltransferase involved in cell wall biosynthesis
MPDRLKQPSISLIVSTYDNPDALRKILESLSVQTLAPLEIIIADDGSGEPTRILIGETIRRLGLPIRHIRQEHEGFRKSIILNRSIAVAHGDYVVFLDGDCVPAKEFIADHASLVECGFWVQGRRAFVDESCVETFTPTTRCVWALALSGKLIGLPKALRLPFPIVTRGQQQRGILGCNLGIWREDLVAINGFDETFVGWGREDADLANRLYHLGRSRKFVYGRAILYHLNHPVASRSRLGDNQSLLDQTIAEKRIRAVKGLDQYLKKS